MIKKNIMAKGKAENNYNTNLASEYLMMSLLSRAGKDAYLSLGNKKGVDIVITTAKGGYAIVEVKGVNKNNDWLIGSKGIFPTGKNLFYALFCFHGKINELESIADFWLIPSEDLAKNPPVKVAKNKAETVYVQYTFVRDNYEKYRNTFKWLDAYLAVK